MPWARYDEEPNLGLALAFNGVGVLATITGLVQPVWVILAMALSIGVVLANSLAGRLLSRPAEREGD